MKKSYIIILGILISFAVGCGDSDDVKPTENMRDWYEITNKPGEVNQTIYRIYKDYGLSIFVNDTLGQEDRGVDSYGNPLIHTELFDMGYYVYGKYTDGKLCLSSDSTAMLKMLTMIEERVAPNLPAPGAYRLHSILLADSIFLTERINSNVVTREVALYTKGVKGIVVGKLNAVNNMEEKELNLLGGKILAVKCTDWILENKSNELEDFYKITNPKNYDKVSPSRFAPAEQPELLGFFDWLEVNSSIVTPSRETDISDYISYVYAYRESEEKFLEEYESFDKIIKKYKIIKSFVEDFERINKK